MARTKLKDRELPDYTKGEEIFNMVSHVVGGALGVVAIVLCVIMAAIHRNIWGIVGGAVYGATMVILYTMSSIYHGLSPKLTAKKVFQVIDHCAIFFTDRGNVYAYRVDLLAGIFCPAWMDHLRDRIGNGGTWHHAECH